MPLTAESLRVPHGFFTRQGGVSSGPYASLNCSLSGGDARDAVLENRARAARAYRRRTGSPGWPHAGARRRGGRGDDTVGRRQRSARRRDGDDRPDIALGIITADCAPILLADPAAGVAGAAHAGWRGAVAGVIEATVAAMVGLGADPAAIVAAIGPCIGQASYEVGRRCS